MTRRRTIFLWCAVVAALIGWYVFRPERAFLNTSVNEAAPGGTVVLRAGRFESRAHQGSGVAQVLELGGGQRVLRLTGFVTSNGPDLQVYLLGSSASSGRADLEASGYVSLGALKGNRGDQNYAIPPGTDLGRFPAVAIWCRRFGVNFTTATLAAPSPGS